MVWDLIISFRGFFWFIFDYFFIFWKNEGVKRGGPEERGRGGLGSSFVYIRFERQYKIFFSGYRESTVF